jgi:hypothetical protein
MKKYLLPLLVLAILFLTSCEEKIDIEKEKEAIKAVIEGEIKASFDGDYETWTTFFANESYTFWLQAWNDGYISWTGWQDISTAAKEWVKPERKGTRIYEGNYGYIIQVYKESALAIFKCKSSIAEADEQDELIGLEVRALEKKNGEWKITYLGTVYSSSYEEEVMEIAEPEEEEPEIEETE